MKSYIDILKKYFPNFKTELGLIFFITLLQSLIVLSIPSVTSKVIDDGITMHNGKIVLIYSIIMLFLYISNSLITIFNNYLMSKVGENIGYKLRKELNEKICKLEYSFFIRNASGDLISSFNKEIEVIKSNISYKLLRVFSNVITLISSVMMIAYISYKAAVIIVFFSMIYILFIRYWGKMISDLSENSFRCNRKVLNILISTYKNVYAIKSNNAQGYISEYFDREYKILYDNEVKLETSYSININLGTLIMNLSTVIFWCLGGLNCISGEITIGKLTAIIGYQNMLINPINFMCDFFNSLHNTIKAIANYNSIINSMEESNSGSKIIENGIYKITFDNVSYKYGDQPIIRNANYSFERGKVYGIIGKSGSGKSTLAKLIVRFLNPDKGNIYINDCNYNDIDIFSLRNEISYVMQESYFFNDTIEKNLVFDSNIDLFNNNYSKLLSLFDEINGMPERWDTVISEFGQNISGGQKKRLEIIRGIIKGGSVLIFDESFTGIDSNRKSIIYELIDKLKCNHIILLITHDDTEIEYCDKVYKIDDI